MRCRGNWELMGTSGQGVNLAGPSFQMLPGGGICAARDAPFGRSFVILADVQRAPIRRENRAHWQCGEPSAQAVGRAAHE